MAVVRKDRVDPNLPQSLNRNMGGGGSNSFPKDLFSGGKNFCTKINFTDYSMPGSLIPNFGGLWAGAGGGGSIVLPIPKKINDVQTVIWEQMSVTAAGLGAAGAMAQGMASSGAGDLANVGLATQGVRLNPHLVMLFKQPNFKEYTFSWTLTPNSRDESDTIKSIVKQFKSAMMPGVSNLFYTYPQIANIRFFPNDDYTMKFKPAAVMAVQVDYTGAGQPSFFKSGAPTAVILTVSFREIELWTRNSNF